MRAKFKLRNGAMVDKTYSPPDFCPFCHRHSAFTDLSYYGIGTGGRNEEYRVVHCCNNELCGEGFVARYRVSTGDYLSFQQVFGGRKATRNFSESVVAVSPKFVTIYNQSEIAEGEGLIEVCGIGYRRALEFLIKDYAKLKSPGDSEKIEGIFLGNCIKDYIKDERIRNVATRATWLGNDEAHYRKSWDKDVSDLKGLIDMTLHFIEMEVAYDEIMKTMPEGKK